MKVKDHYNNLIKERIKNRLLFFWISSYLIASVSYYLLWLVMPRHYVFGSLYRMFLYHWEHPLAYIAIPCFFYGILANAFARKMKNKGFFGRMLITCLIIAVTILISSPFGGMLWHFHDMCAGFFPKDWVIKMITKGFNQGLMIGWLIVGLSIPYNLMGSVICFVLTQKGIEIYDDNAVQVE